MQPDEYPLASDRKLELARRLGIEITEGMTPRELSFLISNAPATDKQREFAAILGAPLPEGATFSQASRLLDVLVPLKCQISLSTSGWEVGDVLAWRGDYFRIVKILRTFDYRMYMKPVDLEPGGGGDPVRVIDRKAPQAQHYPITLEGDAQKVDLETWRPH
jgi:hypothetical protein